MNNKYYELAKKNGWSNKFLQQLKTTNDNIANSYKQQKKALNTKYDNSVSQYEPQKEQARQTAFQTGRNAYVNYMKSINPFSANQNTLARSGMANSGYAESLGLKANNDYLTNVGNALTTRDLALANIDNQISSLENERNSQLSELSRNENNDLVNNYYKIMQLRENQKQRDLARKLANSGSSSGTTYYVDNPPKVKKENNAISLNSTGHYFANYSPIGLSNAGQTAVNTIAGTIRKYGYATGNWINKQIQNLSSDEQQKILKTFKKK